MRPNINIKDMVRAYTWVLEQDERNIDQKVYNVGFENKTVSQLAEMVHDIIPVDIETTPSEDNRSYRINSDKILVDGFKPKHDLMDAILQIKEAYKCKLIPNPLTASNYINIKRMQELGLK